MDDASWQWEGFMDAPKTGGPMSLVKWVARTRLCRRSDDVGEGEVPIQVVPLAALAEVVEGLKLLSQQQPQRSHPLWGEWVNGPDYRTKSFKQWLAQRLLTQLEAHRT